MIIKNVTIKNAAIGDVIGYLERITILDPKELLDPIATGWGYILDISETPSMSINGIPLDGVPAANILISVKRQKSLVSKERNRLTIECLPNRENLITKQIYPDRPIRDAVFFEVRHLTITSIEVTGGYEDYYIQIAPYFVSIWNKMCKTFGSPEGQMQEKIPTDAPPQERAVWERMLGVSRPMQKGGVDTERLEGDSSRKQADQSKRRRPGRKHLPEDLKAWKQINLEKKDRQEVLNEWVNSFEVQSRYYKDTKGGPQNAKRQFEKIIKLNWYKPD